MQQFFSLKVETYFNGNYYESRKINFFNSSADTI
jgi:hypothetical protein